MARARGGSPAASSRSASSASADVRATDVERSRARRARGATLVTPGRRACALRRAAARPRQPGERAGGDRRRARVRRAARRRSPSARPTLAPATHRGEVLALGDGVTRGRRLLQLEPGGARSARSRCWPATPAARGAWPCSARCSSSATTPRRCTTTCGRAAAAAGVDVLVDRRRRRRPRRWPRPPWRPACRGRRSRHVATSAEAADAASRRSCAPATSCW